LARSFVAAEGLASLVTTAFEELDTRLPAQTFHKIPIIMKEKKESVRLDSPTGEIRSPNQTLVTAYDSGTSDTPIRGPGRRKVRALPWGTYHSQENHHLIPIQFSFVVFRRSDFRWHIPVLYTLVRLASSSTLERYNFNTLTILLQLRILWGLLNCNVRGTRRGVASYVSREPRVHYPYLTAMLWQSIPMTR
jgi:hypothetical protein